jgi:hypothetical protein
MKLSEVEKFIRETNGKIFSIKFIKRTPPHEERMMVCRTGVKKHLKGGDAAYNPKAYGLIWVYDMTNAGYRSIPKEGITQIRIEGEWVEVEQDDAS